MRVRPEMHTCGPISTPAPSSTSLPITASGPTVTSSASLAPGSTTAVGWMLGTAISTLLVVLLDDQVGDVERLARVEQTRRAAAHDDRESRFLARALDHLHELLGERALEALLIELELGLELLHLRLDLVAHLREVELLLEQRLVREHELLLLEILFERLVLLDHRLHLGLGVALLARELLAGGLALRGRADRLI